MPVYKYKALTADKKQVSGVVEAYDEFAAIDQIKQNCPVVLDISEASEKQNILTMELGSPKADLKQLSILCSQFAIVLKAGMPVTRTTELMAKQTKDKKLKKLMENVATDVRAGYGLADSFQNKGEKILPVTFIETVRAGEESGTLETSFLNLKDYFERQAMVKEKVKSALRYPIFLLALAAVVVAIVMLVAMPMFLDLFEDMDIEMPLITRMLIAVSDFFAAYWLVIAIALLALILAFRFYINTEKGSLWWAKTILKLPVIGEVSRMKASSQLANTMSTLLAAGLPLIKTTEVTGRVLDNYYMGHKLGSLVPLLNEGRSFGSSLSDLQVFPELLVEMAAMGEETGTMEATLKTIGIHFDNEVDYSTKKALDTLQPVITVALGFIIGIVVIALYVPMFSMYANI